MDAALLHKFGQRRLYALEVCQAGTHIGKVESGERSRLVAMGPIFQFEQLCNFAEAEAQPLR